MLDEERPVAAETQAELTDDERDVAVLIAALVLRPPAKYFGAPFEDKHIRQWLGPAKITDVEVARGTRACARVL